METTAHTITMYVDAGTESDDEELELDNGDAVFRCSCGFTDGAGDIPDVILQAGSHLLGFEEDQADLSPDEWISYVKSGMSEAGINFAGWRWLALKAGVDTAAMDDLDSWRQVEPPTPPGPWW